MNVESYGNILKRMKNHMIAGQTKITDFNKGSMIMTIFESVARPLEQAYVDTRNGYMNNLRAIAYSVFDFEKKTGTNASVNVVFYRGKKGSNAVTILRGTKISDGSYTFITTENAVIQSNQISSNPVAATAEKTGASYNLAANTITTIESVVPGEVVEVNNPSKAYGGSDGENDTQMLARFKTYINGLQGTNYYGLKAGVLAIGGVRSVGIDEHFPPKNNIYNLTVYVDDGTGNLTDSLKETIQKKIDGEQTSENPGLRAAGIQVDVQGATNVPITISVTCKTYRTEDSYAVSEIKQTLEEEINRLGINENVVWTTIILALRKISYVKDVTNLMINGASDNISINVDQIARFEKATVKVESVS